MLSRPHTPLRVLVLTSCILLLISCPTTANEASAEPATLSPPLVPFQFMLGSWKTKETLDPGPMGKGGQGVGEMVVSVGPGGRSIVIDYRTVEGPMSGFAMHEIITFDPETQSFQQAYVTNRTDGLVTARGTAHDDGFIFEHAVGMNGQTFLSRGTIQEISKNSFAMEGLMGPEGGEMSRMMRLEHSRD